MYLVLYRYEDDLHCEIKTKKGIMELLEDAHQWSFLDNAPEDIRYFPCNTMLVFGDGSVIIPKPVEVVKKYDL